jgi:predicted transposase YdaD
LSEYDEEETMELFRQEGIEEGRAIGREEGKTEECISLLSGLVHDGLLSEENAAKRADMSVAEFRKLAAQYS